MKRKLRVVTTDETLLPIDTGIPIPADRRGARKYPFAEMAIGDSFWAPDYTNARTSAGQYGRLHGMRFTGRKDGKGIRIWRTA